MAPKFFHMHSYRNRRCTCCRPIYRERSTIFRGGSDSRWCRESNLLSGAEIGSRVPETSARREGRQRIRDGQGEIDVAQSPRWGRRWVIRLLRLEHSLTVRLTRRERAGSALRLARRCLRHRLVAAPCPARSRLCSQLPSTSAQGVIRLCAIGGLVFFRAIAAPGPGVDEGVEKGKLNKASRQGVVPCVEQLPISETRTNLDAGRDGDDESDAKGKGE